MAYRCDNPDCRAWIRTAYDGYDVRRDYRSPDGKRRDRSWHLAWVCKACAQKEWDHHDNPSGSQQGGLF